MSVVLRTTPCLLLYVGTLAAHPPSVSETSANAEIVARRELLTVAFEWLGATVARDFAAQSRFIPREGRSVLPLA